MSTDIATRTDLSIEPDARGWTPKQIATLRQLGVDRANDADLNVFFHQCVRTGLDPFARQIYMIERQGKQTIQTGIDGYRLVARRAADRAHHTLASPDILWCGPDGKWVDVWLGNGPPAAAKATIIRDGHPFSAVALYSEYVGTKRDGSVTAMWLGKPATMLGKCAEALALRKAFPQDLSGIYTAEEMEQADNSRPLRAVQATEPAPPAEPEPGDPTGEISDSYSTRIGAAETLADLQSVGGEIAAETRLSRPQLDTLGAEWLARRDTLTTSEQAAS